MAINMMCMNSECKYYWEDCCTRNLEEERIEIDENGKCETFEKGKSIYYKCEYCSECNKHNCEACKQEFSSNI